MSKLPPEFVKAPPAEPAPRTRRARKTSIPPAEPVLDPREILLRLTDEEHQALEDARQVLLRAGEEVTLEQMIHRVIAEWNLRAREAAAPTPARRDESIIDRLRALVASPLRTWRDLSAALRRMSGMPAR